MKTRKEKDWRTRRRRGRGGRGAGADQAAGPAGRRGAAASGAPRNYHSPGGHVVDVPNLELPFPLWVDTKAKGGSSMALSD